MTSFLATRAGESCIDSSLVVTDTTPQGGEHGMTTDQNSQRNTKEKIIAIYK